MAIDCLVSIPNSEIFRYSAIYNSFELAMLAEMVACLPLVQQVRGSIPGRVVNFQPQGLEGWRCTLSNCYIVHHTPGLNSKPFRSMYVEKAYSTVDSNSSVGWGR